MLIFLLIWGAFFILTYGLGFAFWQRHFRRSAGIMLWPDFLFSLFFALSGPIGLIPLINRLLKESKFYGFKFLPRVDR